MGDQEVFENKDDAERGRSERSEADKERILGAFGSLHETIGERATSLDVERVTRLREALLTGDRTQVQEHLATTKTESGWLYDELMKHPGVTAILRELSIMGF